MARLLIIEDDSDLKQGLSYSFQLEGYQVTAVSTVKESMEGISNNTYDVILMDCNLPDGNGFELAAQIRAKSNLPILMLTARNTEMDEVKALELGINDYMSKPFSLAVLKLRLKRLVTKMSDNMLYTNGITIDLPRCKVFRGEEEIVLSSVELKMLIYFVENKNCVLSKEQILQYIWDEQGKFVDDNVVSVNIRRLRIKLEEDASHPRYIKTIHGIGYVWEEV